VWKPRKCSTRERSAYHVRGTGLLARRTALPGGRIDFNLSDLSSSRVNLQFSPHAVVVGSPTTA